jgi:ubiquinone/menaquinone biosynthesis C-methylase UbiE
VGPPEIDADAFNAFEAAGWEERADGYDDLIGRVTSRLADPLLDAAHVGGGTRLLDLATGPGYVAARGAERGADAVGVDVAGAMVSLAARLNPGLDFRQADVHALPFEDGSFDAVVGNFVILHLGRPEEATAEFARVLRPGGRLALTTWDRPERARLLGLFLDAVAETGVSGPADLPTGPDLFRFADEAEFEQLLRASGLDHPAVTTISFSHPVTTADELWEGFLRGSLRAAALIVHQPERTRRRIRAAFDRLAREYERDGTLDVPISVKLASATRPRSGAP